MKSTVKCFLHFIKGMFQELVASESKPVGSTACKRIIACIPFGVQRRVASSRIEHDRLVLILGNDVDSLSSYECELRLTTKTIVDCWEKE